VPAVCLYDQEGKQCTRLACGQPQFSIFAIEELNLSQEPRLNLGGLRAIARHLRRLRLFGQVFRFDKWIVRRG
jgi:hypothetical protein